MSFFPVDVRLVRVGNKKLTVFLAFNLLWPQQLQRNNFVVNLEIFRMCVDLALALFHSLSLSFDFNLRFDTFYFVCPSFVLQLSRSHVRDTSSLLSHFTFRILRLALFNHKDYLLSQLLDWMRSFH